MKIGITFNKIFGWVAYQNFNKTNQPDNRAFFSTREEAESYLTDLLKPKEELTTA